MNRRIRTACSLAVLALGAMSAVAQESPQVPLTEEERAWLDEQPAIRVAPAPNFPPIEFFDEDGVYRGLVADYVALFEERLGVEFEVVRYESWADVVEATRRREVDVWFEAGVTEERREYLDFTDPYIRLPAVIIVRREVSGNLDLDDLAGRTVAVVEGYATVDFLRSEAPDVELIEVPSVAEGLERVSFGSVYAIVASSGPASYFIEDRGLTGLRVAGQSGFVWELAIASRNDWPLLHSILQKTLASIDVEQRQALFRRWVSLEQPQAGFPWGWLIGFLLVAAVFGLLLVARWRRRERREESSGRVGLRGDSAWPVYAAGVVVIGAIVVLLAQAQQRIRERLRLDTEVALRTVLRTTSQAVYQWFDEHEANVRQFAARPEVVEACRELTGASRTGVLQSSELDRLRINLDLIMRDRGYDGFSILSPVGRVIASDLDALIGTSPSRSAVTELLDIAASSRRTAIGVPRRSGVDGDGVTSVTAAARTAGGCVLAISIDPEDDFTQILQRGRLGESGETYAFNRQGQLLSESRSTELLWQLGLVEEGQRAILNLEIRDPGGNLMQGHEPAAPREQQPFTLMVQKATSGEDGVNLDGYNDYRGVPVIGAWVWDEDSELGIATEMEADEAYESFRWIRGVLRVGGGFAVVLVVALMVMFARARHLQREQSEGWTRRILDSALDGVVMTDADGVVTFWNPQAEKIFGWPAHEARGRHLQDLVMPEPEARTSRISGFARQLIGRDESMLNRRIERTVRDRDGREFPLEFAVLPIEEGGRRSFSVFLRDITERRRAEETEKQKERMESELSIGREIQTSMLPLTFPAFSERTEFTIFARLEPAREVGGDFYDFFFIDDDHFFFCVGDVSGKGVPSALFMAVTKTLIKARANQDRSTGSIMSYVNGEIAESNEASMFVTLFGAILNVRTGELCYTNAGHNPPFVKQCTGEVVKLGQRHGPVVGAVAGLAYGEETMALDPGDLVVLFTDGLTEATNDQGKLYSESRFASWLADSEADTVEDTVGGIVTDVRRFEAGAPQADDLTVLALAYHGVGGRTAEPELLQMELTNERAEIARVEDAFSRFAEERDLAVPIVRKFKLVFDELLHNTIAHAYDDDDTHSIAVNVRYSPDRLLATITDDGKPFNPLRYGTPAVEASIDDREPGGLGIHLVRSVMDEVNYHREVDRNVVTVVKYLGVDE